MLLLVLLPQLVTESSQTLITLLSIEDQGQTDRVTTLNYRRWNPPMPLDCAVRKAACLAYAIARS